MKFRDKVGPGAAGNAAMLEVRSVSLSFDALQVLRDINLVVYSGSILGLIGPNGSGKTSLLNCINGIYRPDQGNVSLGHVQLTGIPAHRIASIGVARTFQHVDPPRDITVLNFVMLGRHVRMTRFGTLAYGLGVPSLLRYERSHRDLARAALGRVGLDGLDDRLMGGLPYGLVKRVDLARALAGDPNLLLLDEPVAGLNQVERQELAEVLSSLDRSEMAVCVVEHDMAFVSKICDRLHVLSGGQTIASGLAATVLARPDIAETFLGTYGSTVSQ
jgi:branched-chain amino acid transport system ATP-binding protein